MAILGIDEVGRGPLAGPLVVGAVVLPEFLNSEVPEWILELKDSKKLTAKKREALNEVISKKAAFGLGWVFVDELDRIGISEALRLATRRAVKSIQETHKPFSQIVIDGKVNFLKGTALENYVSTMPKADNLVREVSAASIVAKVARDRYMVEVSERFPGYGFEKHVGYGTAKHLAAIRELGVCAEHRRSFEPIKSMVGFDRDREGIKDNLTVVKNTTVVGCRGEEAVVEYLENLGHKIVVRNHKTKFYEIDIVSVFEDKIYFTEVKTRKNNVHGSGLEYVTKEKLAKMRFAAECFMKYKKCDKNPILAAASVNGDYKVLDWVIIR